MKALDPSCLALKLSRKEEMFNGYSISSGHMFVFVRLFLLLLTTFVYFCGGDLWGGLREVSGMVLEVFGE